MKNRITYVVVGLLIIILISIYLQVVIFKNTPKELAKTVGYKDVTFIIDGSPVTLNDGKSSNPVAPGSDSNITTQYFGNEVSHDFDGDGRSDIAYILTQNTGGSGTSYYIVAALNKVDGYIGSDAVLLGDRISPQTVEISKDPSTPNVVIVNYAIRKDGEDFTTHPSVGKSLWLKLDTITMKLGEVVQNFEGETDTAKLSLKMKSWEWIYTAYNNGTKITPNMTGKFTLTFNDEKAFSASTDCNSLGGEYNIDGKNILFTKMISTLMYCEGSQEQDFSKMLNEASNYQFNSKGELVIDLSNNGGQVVFR